MICPIDEHRYGNPEMLRIFSVEKKLELWLKVEAALALAHAKVGDFSFEIAREIERKANLDYVSVEAVKKYEKEIKHDLMAMVKALTDVCQGVAKAYVHLGATSNDIKDTALAIQLRDAHKIIVSRVKTLLDTLLELSEKYKTVVAVGRTHGQHANPITYGLKFSVYASEIYRHLERLVQLRDRLIVGKMTGATGTQAAFGKKGLEIQKHVMEYLGLKTPLVTTQIVQRDRHAEFLLVLALIAATADKISTEIRNLQRTEIAEVEEYFEVKKQVGSSAMPSKRNPIRCERISGLSRVIRHMAFSSLDNIPLWHERDLTNSSSERIIIPHTIILTEYIIDLLTKVLKTIRIKPKNIEKNLNLTRGLNMSESVVMRLVDKGVPRQEAHEIVRECAMMAIEKDIPFKDALLSNEIIKTKLSEREIIEALNPKKYIGTAVEQVEHAIETIKRRCKALGFDDF